MANNENPTSLKGKNQPFLVGSLLAMILVFGAVFRWKFTGEGEIASKLATSAVVTAIVGGLAFVLQEWLHPDLKTRLVFWKFKGIPYPGSEAFSRWMHEDARVDPKILEKRHGPLPTDPVEENRLWYKLSRKHEGKANVQDTHRRFLLGRDLVAVWLSFGLLSSFIVWFGKAPSMAKLGYDAAFLLGYVSLTRVAAINGCRFVTTVLAEESASKND